MDRVVEEGTLVGPEPMPAFEEAVIGMGMLDLEGRFITVNAALCDLLGRSRTDLVSSTLHGVTGEDDIIKVFDAAASLGNAMRAPFVFEKPCRHAGGRTMWLSIAVSIVEDRSNRAFRLFAQFVDVSERKSAEGRLGEALGRYRSLVENLPAITYILNAADDFATTLYISPQIQELLGLSPEFVMAGRDMWWPGTHPEDCKDVESAMWEHVRTGRPLSIEYRMIATDGRILWFRDEATMVRDAAGRLLYGQGVMHDITERKEAEASLRASEERFRSLIQNSLDVVVIYDAAAVVTYVSSSVDKVMGHSTEAMLGKAGFELVHPEDRPRARRLFERALRGAEGGLEAQVRARHGDGSWRWLEMIASNQLGIPSVEGIVVNYRDTTERHSLEGQLRQSQKMEAIGRLAGGVAHDFNNLLSVIQNYASLILESFDAGDQRGDDAHEIVKASERAANLTRQLLAFSRKEVARTQVVDLNEVISGFQKLLGPTIGEHIRLDMDLIPNVRPIKMDPNHLEQVIMNLAVNARDAMPLSGELSIATFNDQVDDACAFKLGLEPGDYACLRVTDSGHGIPEDIRSQVFEPFFTTKPVGAGTGLGLSTVHGIVAQAGGAIAIDSNPSGKGSAFNVYFPAVEMDVDDRPDAAPTPERAPGAETILVVEDEPALLGLVKRVLERQDYGVLAANGGPDAIECARLHPGPIHLLVTDVVMPGMSGKVVAERLEALRGGIKTLFMSGYPHDVISERGLSDIEHYLAKPFRAEDLLKSVREALEA